MTLEQILRRAGLTEHEAMEFSTQMRTMHKIAEGLEGSGVNAETIKTLTELLGRLGVATW
jgi:hypothetical protein